MQTLRSALPMDTSALDASMAALKSSISALESSIKALEGSSGLWETLAWSCAIAVGIGIVGEVWAIVGEHQDDLEAWRRGIVRPPDHPNVRRFWFDIVATLLVLVGVFGEAGASMRLASINSQLRSKTSELRADSDQLLALVTQEAGSAATSAHDAKQDEEQLGKNTKAAEATLATQQKKAKNAELDLDAYLTQLRSPRDIVLGGRDGDQDERAKRFAEIDKYRGTTAVIQWIPEWEPTQYAMHLSLALSQHGWGIVQMTPVQSHIPYEIMNEGVSITTFEGWGKSKAYATATALVNLLDLDLGPPYGPEYFGVHWDQPGMTSFTQRGFVYPKDGVLILVGTRPSFHPDAIHRHPHAQ